MRLAYTATSQESSLRRSLTRATRWPSRLFVLSARHLRYARALRKMAPPTAPAKTVDGGADDANLPVADVVVADETVPIAEEEPIAVAESVETIEPLAAAQHDRERRCPASACSEEEGRFLVRPGPAGGRRCGGIPVLRPGQLPGLVLPLHGLPPCALIRASRRATGPRSSPCSPRRRAPPQPAGLRRRTSGVWRPTGRSLHRSTGLNVRVLRARNPARAFARVVSFPALKCQVRFAIISPPSAQHVRQLPPSFPINFCRADAASRRRAARRAPTPLAALLQDLAAGHDSRSMSL